MGSIQELKKMKLFAGILAATILVSVDACGGGGGRRGGGGRSRDRSRAPARRPAPRPTTTRPTTTTTRAPSACEINQLQLLVINPDQRHIMVCEVNGDYAPDQYQDNGLTYCIDEEGNKIGETQRLDYASVGSRFAECDSYRY